MSLGIRTSAGAGHQKMDMLQDSRENAHRDYQLQTLYTTRHPAQHPQHTNTALSPSLKPHGRVPAHEIAMQKIQEKMSVKSTGKPSVVGSEDSDFGAAR